MADVFFNPTALERFRPTPQPRSFITNFCLDCPVHGAIAHGMRSFEEMVATFGSHALAAHNDLWDTTQLTFSWDDVPYRLVEDFAI